MRYIIIDAVYINILINRIIKHLFVILTGNGLEAKASTSERTTVSLTSPPIHIKTPSAKCIQISYMFMQKKNSNGRNGSLMLLISDLESPDKPLDVVELPEIPFVFTEKVKTNTTRFQFQIQAVMDDNHYQYVIRDIEVSPTECGPTGKIIQRM